MKLLTVKSYIKGPKTARLSAFLKELAVDVGITVEITDIDRGWFTETVFFTVTGERAKLTNFNEYIQLAIVSHNAT